MKINPECDLLMGNRPENDSDNQYLECEDCRRYEICKKHGYAEMVSLEEIKEAMPNAIEPSYNLMNWRIDRMSISEHVHYLRSLAADQTPEALYEVFDALNEAADTIESLSAKLQGANMERSEKKIIFNSEDDREYEDYICPNCKDILQQRRKGATRITVYKYKFCHNCGQKLGWSDIP